jgi:hypothetical protein
MTFKQRFNKAYGRARRAVGEIWLIEANSQTIQKMSLHLNWTDSNDPSVFPPQDPNMAGWVGTIAVCRNEQLQDDQLVFEAR